jgi:hypothetical protein
MISTSELKSFYNAALQKKRYGEIVHVLFTQYSSWFRVWRWKYGISFRRQNKIHSTPKIARSEDESIAINAWTGDIKNIVKSARSYFKNGYVISPKYKDTFRAAGGKRLPWGFESDDIQDVHAWHRLYWVLDSDPDLTQQQLQLWLDHKPDEISMHPYTVSERIHNLCEYIALNLLPDALLSDLVDQIYGDASFLESNIESHLGVHNHILNNARALSIAGFIFQDDEQSKIWTGKAMVLWTEYWPKLILEDGFFAEQSSFYHVLMTRTLLDYLAHAKRLNVELSQSFMEQVDRMCSVTNLLVRPDGSIPIFGDASPDMPIEWLRGLVEACHNYGYLKELPRDTNQGYAGGVNHINDATTDTPAPETSQTQQKDIWETQHFKDSGFLFSRNDSRKLELSALGTPGPEFHGHSDSGQGSFEIWWNNRNIVVDGGIPIYGVSPQARDFRGAQGQNCISLAGISPTPFWDEINQLPKWYSDKKISGSWDIKSHKATFNWYGFGRYKSGLMWSRTWECVDQFIRVTDKISGVDQAIPLQAYLHFGETGWQIESDHRFRNNGCRLELRTSESVKVSLGDMQYSPDYGVIKESQGITVNGKVRLPFEMEWSFEFGEGKSQV